MLKNIAYNVKAQISSQALNQETLSEQALTAFFAGGHILLEGPSGLGKTTWARAFAQAIGANCNRVRFNENTLPTDIVGAPALNPYSGQVEMRRGPLFTQVFLADGVGYAIPKTAATLMDAIEDHTAIAEGERYSLPEPFFVIATHDGVHTPSDALADLFMLKLTVGYPGIGAEKQILQMHHEASDNTQPAPPICTPEDLAEARREVKAVAVEDAIFNYIISIVETTRRVGAVYIGASPRGSIALLDASKAYAAIQGRDYVIMDDVRNLAVPVLRHRVKLKPDAIREGIQADRIIESILIGRRMA